MFESLRSAFDVIIIDSPPVLAVVDALVVLPWTDGVVLVVKSGETPYPVVERARKKIEEVQGRILGVTLNHVEFEHLRYVSYRRRPGATPRAGVGRHPGFSEKLQADRLTSQTDIAEAHEDES